MKVKTLYFGVLLCLNCVACHQGTPDHAYAKSHTERQVSVEKEIVDVRGDVAIGNPSSWQIDTFKLGSLESFDSIYFLDDVHGWVAGASTLYKTINAGETWRQVEIKVPQQARISDIFFVNASLGWVVAQKCKSSEWCEEDYLWLMHTGNGGETWQLQYEGNGLVESRINFTDEQDGWLIGTKYNWVSRFTPLVLHTSDGGQHWKDVSAGLSLIIAEDKDIAHNAINDGAVGIVSESPLEVTVLTGRRKILRTVDGGQSWRQIGFVHNEFEQTRISRFGVNGGRHFIAGGAFSEEGVWGVLAFEQETGSWVRHELDGVYFADAVFLLKNQVLACGSIPNDKDTRGRRQQRDGVILYSSESGQSWVTIYRSPQVKSINALASVSSNQIWAVGDDGLILRLSHPPKK